MLALCGHPYADEDIQVFHNLFLLEDDISLDSYGIESWSVLDVVVEDNENAPSELEELDSDGVCRADYEATTREDPEYEFTPGELQNVEQLSIALSGRFIDV